MGMSASQMRYCLLSGRQTDLQFQGQQINQQRTTLATETSTYNNQLLTLNVPTPPSKNDFSKVDYAFTNNKGQACNISGIQYQDAAYVLGGRNYNAGTYIVNYTYDSIADKGQTAGTKSVINAAGVYTVGTNAGFGNTLEAVDLASYLTDTAQATDFNNILKICQDCNITDGGVPIDTSAALAALPAGTFFKYTSDKGTTYMLASELPGLGTTSDVNTYYVAENVKTTQSDQLGGAEVNWSESGRMSSMTTTDQFGNESTYTLSTSVVEDNTAYTSAMNEYEYKKGIYEKAMNDINAKLDVVQAQDKTLQLKLQDLDTQNKAIQTEIESVKKVVDKNIEQSFKAFA